VLEPRLDLPTHLVSNFRLPFIASDLTIVRIPRPNYDDYDLFVRSPMDSRRAGEYMVADMNQVTGAGGFYVSSMHTTAPWGGLNPDKISALSALLRALPDRPLWVTTVKEAADWWEKRSHVQIAVTKYSDSVILLQVTNTGRQNLDNLPIEV